jgi:COMPASS component SWD3
MRGPGGASPPATPPHVAIGDGRLPADYFDPSLVDEGDEAVRLDVLRMIAQYLLDEGLPASFVTLQDEAQVRYQRLLDDSKNVRSLRTAVLDGDWTEAEKVFSKPQFKAEPHLMYAVYKQQFLELIERQEMQKAYSCLAKKLKPLERFAEHTSEFLDLSYLLTCKSVQEARSFKDWDGAAGTSRERLVEQFPVLMRSVTHPLENLEELGRNAPAVPPHRLKTLLKQAVAYQVSQSGHPPRAMPAVSSLLSDYSPLVIPDSLRLTYLGHTENVKAVQYVGIDGRRIVSGGSDNVPRVWSTADGSCLAELRGHTSRIWDIACTDTGNFVATASGDGTLRIWSLAASSLGAPKATLSGHLGDVYCVRYHPDQTHIATGGYDRTVRLFDVEAGRQVVEWSGHCGSVSGIAFNPSANLVVTGYVDFFYFILFYFYFILFYFYFFDRLHFLF